MPKSIDEVGVAEFKAQVTKLLPRVARTGRVLRVLKRGRVLVEVHPPRQARPEPFVGRARGLAVEQSDLTDTLEEPWEADGEQSAREATLAVSAISVWELAMLVKRGRLRLASAVGLWIEASLRPPGVRIIPVGTAIALDSSQLPAFDRRRDPADRLIVATARRHGTLLTCDQPLLDWATAHRHVRVVDGRA